MEQNSKYVKNLQYFLKSVPMAYYTVVSKMVTEIKFEAFEYMDLYNSKVFFL